MWWTIKKSQIFRKIPLHNRQSRCLGQSSCKSGLHYTTLLFGILKPSIANYLDIQLCESISLSQAGLRVVIVLPLRSIQPFRQDMNTHINMINSYATKPLNWKELSLWKVSATNGAQPHTRKSGERYSQWMECEIISSRADFTKGWGRHCMCRYRCMCF